MLPLFLWWPATFRYNQTRDISMPKSKSNHQAALLAIEKVLALLRSMQTLEGTDKDGVEHLLEIAIANLKK